MPDRPDGRAAFAAVLVLDAVGAGGGLFVSTRPWQTVVSRRPRPFADTVLHVSGRTLDAGPTALCVVAIAGVVALLATRGIARRIVGVGLVLAGIGLAWRSATAAAAISSSRAQSLAAAKHPGVALGTHVQVHALWAVLSVVAGALVACAGLVTAWRGHRWAGMSSRYETPAAQDDQPRADATMWAAIDRGDDPTRGPSEPA